jgi:hypothetical protein
METTTVDFEKLSQLFIPEIYNRFKEARDKGTRFAQYTSADSALTDDKKQIYMASQYKLYERLQRD